MDAFGSQVMVAKYYIMGKIDLLRGILAEQTKFLSQEW